MDMQIQQLQLLEDRHIHLLLMHLDTLSGLKLLQQLALLRTLVPLLICHAADTGDNFSMLSALLAADCVL